VSFISNVTPSYDELSSQETKVYTFDFTALIIAGDIVSLPTSKLTDLTTGILYPKALSGSVSIMGNLVSQTIFKLIPNHKYRFEMYVTLNTGKILGAALEIFCPW
jgi:hypothetical protein